MFTIYLIFKGHYAHSGWKSYKIDLDFLTQDMVCFKEGSKTVLRMWEEHL